MARANAERRAGGSELSLLAKVGTIEADALRVGIEGRTLIDGLNVCIAPGELWCLLGANGVGKTMLLHTLVGLHRPSSGTVRIDGRSLPEWSVESLSHKRAFLPQLIPSTIETSVLDLVLMGRHPFRSRWQWEDDDDRAIASDALRAVDLQHVANHDAARLSGGERQRVAIAALLAQQAPVMLLDEPVAHLDLHHQIVVLDHLRVLAASGHSILLSIHDLNLARRFATHAILMHADGTSRVGAVDDIMESDALSAAFGHGVLVLALDGGDRKVFVAQ